MRKKKIEIPQSNCPCKNFKCKIDENDSRHGTRLGYNDYLCRCVPCTLGHKSAYRNAMLMRRFNITEQDYLALVAAQDYGCGICKRPVPSAATELSVRSFAVDHDHACCPGKYSCGKCVRGVLCFSCNTKLGFVERFKKEIDMWLR